MATRILRVTTVPSRLDQGVAPLDEARRRSELVDGERACIEGSMIRERLDTREPRREAHAVDLLARRDAETQLEITIGAPSCISAASYASSAIGHNLRGGVGPRYLSVHAGEARWFARQRRWNPILAKNTYFGSPGGLPPLAPTSCVIVITNRDH